MLQHVGQIYTHTNRHEDAARCYRRAANLAPTNAQYLYNDASSAIALGRLGEAEDLLDRVIKLTPTDYDAYYNRATLRRQTASRNHVAEMERVLASSLRHPMGEVQLCYALAKELEDLGEEDRGFTYLKRGAEARRRMLAYRVEEDVAAMAEIASVFDERFFSQAHKGNDDARPLFIIGLPRSGTTLIDRILSSHSRVASLGETGDFAMAVVRLLGHGDKSDLIRRSRSIDFAALGNAYCASATALGVKTERLVDKTPVNFLYLGLIALALPKARIVHIRRGAMDACYAMYKTLFRMAYPFSYDLHDLGVYYLAYHTLMAHWEQVLPNRFLDIGYEELIADQEATTRRLLAHCGLEWEEACLHFERNPSPSLTASAAQVRQPIYKSSIGRWRRHEKELAPLASMLHEAGVEVDCP